VHVVVDRHQSGRATTDGVEERNELRHRGHGHLARHPQADAATDDEATEDDPDCLDAHAARPDWVARREQPQEGDDHRERHAGRAELVAAARGGGRVHLVQSKDEAGRADQPGQEDQGVDRGLAHLSRFLNI
jgi:hypothetical protein